MIFVPMVVTMGMPMTNGMGTPITSVFCAHDSSHGHAHGLCHGRAYDYVHGHVYYWQTRGQELQASLMARLCRPGTDVETIANLRSMWK